VTIEPIFWEHEPCRATATFQEQIPRAGESDIVVFILWSRLGTPLLRPLRPDGTQFSSGTEFEFEDALDAHKARGTPDLLVYRKTAEPFTVLDEHVVQRLEQKRAVEAFLKKWFFSSEGSFTAAFNDFKAPAQFEERLEKHLRKLIEGRLPQLRAQGIVEPPKAIWTKGSPFRGLQHFDFEHSAVFCGRTEAISEILDVLRRQSNEGCAFALITGMSGVGKSSLMRAGLLPTLTTPGVIEGVGLWRRAIFRPSDSSRSLLDGLATALTKEDALPELLADGTSVEELARIMRASESLPPLIRARLQIISHEVYNAENLTRPPSPRFALSIDQLEEIFTTQWVTPADRAAFVSVLSALARSGVVWVFATMRSDFYPRCGEVPELLTLKANGQYDLRPPSPGEISQMIRYPTRVAGLRFDEDVKFADQRLDDVLRDHAVRDPQALPLLEFTLEELYNSRAEGGVLTYAAYQALGGLEGALAKRAEDVFTALPPAAKATFSQVMSSLVVFGQEESGTAARRRASLAEACTTPESKQLVEAFVVARLFVADRADDDTPVVNLAHEALLLHWPRLTNWLALNKDRLRMRARIVTAATFWSEQKEKPEYLLPAGDFLAEAQQMLGDPSNQFGAVEARFIRKSIEESGRKQRRTRGTRIAVGAAVFLVVAAVVGYWDGFVATRTEYYSSFVRIHTIPTGIGQLSESVANHRHFTFKLYKKGRYGRLEKGEQVDGYDKLSTEPGVFQWITGFREPLTKEQKVNVWRFFYNERGEITEESWENSWGKVLYRFKYSTHDDPNQVYAHFETPQGLPTAPMPGSYATYVKFTRNSAGYDTKVEFLYNDEENNPHAAADIDGNYGYRIEYDGKGPATKFILLGDKLSPKFNDILSFTTAEARHDSQGNSTEVSWFDDNHKPLRTGEFTYDQYGNQASMVLSQYNDRAEKAPFLRLESEYGNRGELLAKVWSAYNNAEPYPLFRIEYDSAGDPTRQIYLDAKQQPVVNPTLGYATIKWTYDAKGQPTAATGYDANDKPLGRIRPTITAVDKRNTLDIREGDIIVSYNKVPAFSWLVLSDKLNTTGGDRPLGLERNGTRLVVQVPSGYLGLTIQDKLYPSTATPGTEEQGQHGNQ
jgi:hypothetical protein